MLLDCSIASSRPEVVRFDGFALGAKTSESRGGTLLTDCRGGSKLAAGPTPRMEDAPCADCTKESKHG